MGKKPCCDKVGLKKGPWTADEDSKLINFMLSNCHCSWRAVPKLAGLLRCGKSCRLRWINYLRPDLKRGLLSDTEEKLVIDLHARLGNKWSKIASHLPGRTDNEIKNYWNTHIKKKLIKMGIDPFTHNPIATTGEYRTQQPEAHCEREAEEQKAMTLSSTEIDEATLRKSPGFCIEEVPMVQPHEMVIPAASIDSSSASRSPCSSSGCSRKGEVLQFSPEWSKPMDLWLMDDITAWDLGFNNADEVPSIDEMI